MIHARSRDRHAPLRRASTVCVVDRGFDGQQPKRSGAHHLVVMNSTRSTLLEVEQMNRQPRGRPQSEAKARTEVIGDSTKCGRHARACFSALLVTLVELDSIH